MLRSTKHMMGYTLLAEDGEIGRCRDFLFDDQKWVVRYMLADTSKWLNRKRVLVSPIALGTPDWQAHQLPVRLSKAQIENGPPLNEDPPVSTQYEIEHARHFGYRPYWVGPGLWGGAVYPSNLYGVQLPESQNWPEHRTGDPHLRSINEVVGYHIAANDGEIGHVEDFVIDDQTWRLRFMVVDTRNWLPGPKTIIAPEWADAVDWGDRRVRVSLSTAQIRYAPEYDPSVPVNEAYEKRLYDFYGRPREL